MFSFDFYIHTNREFVPNAKFLNLEDMTDGRETVPISVVNSIDSERPEHFLYSPIRSAMKDVPLNLSTDNLDGCNCEDNCRDRLKCSCWRKTFELTTFADNEMNTNVGYRNKRLPQPVETGVFECNSRCKCDHRCSNRVVQNGITIRLQLYKTLNKGWGIRCLDDVPKGTFISVYSGQIMTEKHSYTRNQEYGDKYFAELDFIECLRRLRISNAEAAESESDIYDSDSDMNRSRLPKKNLFSKVNTPEIEYICLDSDEDEQDREQKSPLLSQTDFESTSGLELKRIIKEEKEKEFALLIDSNRYFTQNNNKIFANYLKKSEIYIMDASIYGNIARFINHSCTPNVCVQNVFIDTYDFRFPWIAFFTMNSIKAGTELCWVCVTLLY